MLPNPNFDYTLQPQTCYIGTANLNGKQQIFGINQEDRRKHVYILGKTGMGKTTLIENMILQDIYNGFGVCFIDPHGDASEYILDRIPIHRHTDIIYLNPADTEFPVGLNVLEAQRGEEPFLIASNLMAVFNKIWAGSWSSRMEYILNNTLLALLETPGNTLLGVIKMLTDEQYRKKVVQVLQDPIVKNFWINEFANFNARYRQEAISPILNKIGQFFSMEVIRNMLGQTKSTIDIRQIMDENKILIVNLSKGRLGEENSNLLGSLLVAKLQVAAMSRVDIVEEERQDFFVYVDEFQNFTNDSFATILSEARKYRLNLILAHQYIAQLTESGSNKIKNAIFGNVGTMMTFRLGSQDAKEMSKEFAGSFNSAQLIALDRTQVVIKLSTDDTITKPFLANTLPPIFSKLNGQKPLVIDVSRQYYTTPKALVAGNISKWLSEETVEENKYYPNKKKVYKKTDILGLEKRNQNENPNMLKTEESENYSKNILEMKTPGKNKKAPILQKYHQSKLDLKPKISQLPKLQPPR